MRFTRITGVLVIAVALSWAVMHGLAAERDLPGIPAEPEQLRQMRALEAKMACETGDICEVTETQGYNCKSDSFGLCTNADAPCISGATCPGCQGTNQNTCKGAPVPSCTESGGGCCFVSCECVQTARVCACVAGKKQQVGLLIGCQEP